MTTPSAAGECYFVTGGAGFIGSALVRHLIGKSDATIINIDKLTYAGNMESLGAVRDHPRHHFARLDICDAPAIGALFAQWRPRGVYHLAAESHVDRSIDAPDDFLRTNVMGTCVLLQEALRHWRTLSSAEANAFRFVHVSTDEVFGSAAPGERFTEASAYHPSSPYSASKAAADHFVRAWHRTYGLPTVVTTCSNNYGPCQFPEKLIPLVIQKALSGAPIPVYGDGEQVRDWLYVDDHAVALQAVMTQADAGSSYGIGGGEASRNLDIVRAACALLDEMRPDPAGRHERLIVHVVDRPGHDRRYAMDAGRIRADLGWQPNETIASGLRKTVAWYLANEAWTAHVTSGAYRGERLGAP